MRRYGGRDTKTEIQEKKNNGARPVMNMTAVSHPISKELLDFGFVFLVVQLVQEALLVLQLGLLLCIARLDQRLQVNCTVLVYIYIDI